MLNAAELAAYKERGFVHLPGAFGREAAQRLADRVWAELESRRGICRDDPRTWNVPGPWVGLKSLKQEPLFRSVECPSLCSALDDLLGAGNWQRPPHWGGFLVGFPDRAPGDWRVPHEGWHVDAHFTREPGHAFGVRVFTFLTEVGERGGGTLIVRGSHRLVEEFVASMTTAQRKQGFAILKARFCASHPWLAALTSKDASGAREHFMHRTHVIDGVPVRVDELRGSPGDVVLAHPWFLHATAPNAGAGPRFMLARDVEAHAPRAARAPA